MTKVFLITCSYPDESGSFGGVFIHNQAVALKKFGYDVSVLFYDFRSIRKKRKLGISYYRLDGIDIFRYAFPCGPIQPLFSFLGKAFGYKLFKYASKIKGKPDLLHAHFVDAAKIALRLSHRTGIRYYLTEHNSSVIQECLSSKEKKDSALVYQNAKCVIAVSKGLEDSVRRITDCKTKVVPNIIPQYFFDQPIEDRSNNKVSDFIFISVGFFNQRKRFDLVLRAFQKVSRQRGNVYLEIAGSGSLENYLKELAASLGVSENVRFLGAIQNRELPNLYSSRDCFVLASDFETFGVVYAEALACGLPVIATKCGGPEEIIKDYNGVLVNRNDIDELENAMLYMIDNRKKYDSALIREDCMKNYSEQRVADELTKLYKGSSNDDE